MTPSRQPTTIRLCPNPLRRPRHRSQPYDLRHSRRIRVAVCSWCQLVWRTWMSSYAARGRLVKELSNPDTDPYILTKTAYRRHVLVRVRTGEVTLVGIRGRAALVVTVLKGRILWIDVSRYKSHIDLIGRNFGLHVNVHDTLQALLHPD